MIFDDFVKATNCRKFDLAHGQRNLLNIMIAE